MAARRNTFIGLAVLLGLAILAGFAAALTSGFPAGRDGLDNLFGDQHLKTTVALVELHERRYGRYPASLDDLRFTGEWDRIALDSTHYCTNPDRSAYHIEVKRGWMGEPDLSPPAAFWRGTGFSESLGPCP